jgi:hypothetical protein
MNRMPGTTSRVAGAALALLALTAAVRPAVFSQATGGLWEISRSDGGRRNVCVPDPVLLAQYEHLKSRCSRDVIRDLRGRAEISYSCAGGGFGQSKVEQLTPRSLRIETQGISGDAPFHYVVQARRVGDC